MTQAVRDTPFEDELVWGVNWYSEATTVTGFARNSLRRRDGGTASKANRMMTGQERSITYTGALAAWNAAFIIPIHLERQKWCPGAETTYTPYNHDNSIS